MATIQFMSPVLMDKCVHVDLTIWYHGIQISIAHVLSLLYLIFDSSMSI